jgi:hypothetical protein
MLSDIWSSNNCDCEDYCYLGCDAMYCGRLIAAFRRNISVSIFRIVRGSKFLWIIDDDLPDYMATHSRRQQIVFIPQVKDIQRVSCTFIKFQNRNSVHCQYIYDCSGHPQVRGMLLSHIWDSHSSDYECYRCLGSDAT